MFDIIFIPKAEWSRATHLNHVSRTVYPLGSQFKLSRGTSSLEQMRLLGHVNTKQRCEIQSVWNAWIQRRTQAEQKKILCATSRSEGFSIYTSPLFTMDLLQWHSLHQGIVAENVGYSHLILLQE